MHILDLTPGPSRGLNGRTVGDLSGKFTSFQYNGNSVVDYCLISNSFTNNVLYFNISLLVIFLFLGVAEAFVGELLRAFLFIFPSDSLLSVSSRVPEPVDVV